MFQFLLEDGTGNYQIEDSSGNYVLDIPTKVINSTVLATETRNRLTGLLKFSQATINVTEHSPVVYYKGIVKSISQFLVSLEEAFSKKVTFDVYSLENGSGSYLLEDGSGLYKQDIMTKVVSSIVGITGTQNRLRGRIKNITDTLNITEVSQKVEGFVRIATQKIVNFQETIASQVSNLDRYIQDGAIGAYILENGGGYYAIDNLEIIKNIVTDTIGLSSIRNQIDGTVHNFNQAISVALSEIHQRYRSQVRNITDTVKLDSGLIRARIMYRNIVTDTINIAEVNQNLKIIIRNMSSTLALDEGMVRVRIMFKNIADNIIITENMNFIEGIVKYISDTINFTDVATHFRILGISFNTGDYITLSLINLSNFITSTQQDTGDMIRFSAYNSEDMRITDD